MQRRCLPGLDIAGQEVDSVASRKAEAAHVAVAVQHVVIPLPAALCMQATCTIRHTRYRSDLRQGPEHMMHLLLRIRGSMRWSSST